MSPFKSTLNRFLENAFGIQPDEQMRALLMQANIFLIITTLLIVKPMVAALFLSRFGVEQLPIVFILVAVAAAVVSSLYTRLLSKYSLRSIFRNSTVASVIALLAFGIFLNLGFFVGPILYLFYVWVAIFALLSTSQFWVLANLVFNAREAKRLFGFIGAGAIAGGILGGYITSLLANFTSSENLSFVAAGTIAICLPISRKIWLTYQPSEEEIREAKIGSPKQEEHPLKLILQSQHLTYVAGIVGVSVIVAKLVDYQFSGIAAQLVPEKDELTSFLGFWFSTFNLISLLLQLFLTRRIVDFYGVGTSLFFLPILILIATVFIFIMPELLLAAVFLKMADGSLKQSINKAAIELVIMPISTRVKNRTKTFIDVFVDSLATGISGLLLLGLVKGFDLSTRAVSVMVVAFIGVWIYLANKVQKEYIRSFKINLESSYRENRGLKKKFDLKSPRALAQFRRMLDHGSEEQLLFVLRKLRKMKRKDFIQPVTLLLSHLSSKVRAEAVSTLYHFHGEEVVNEIIPLTADESPKVKAQAYEYLLAHSTNGNFTVIEEYLDDPDEWIRNAAIVTLARQHRKKPRKKKSVILENHIREKIKRITNDGSEYDNQRKRTLAKAIGFGKVNALYGHLRNLLSDADDEVVKQAILSAGDTLDNTFVEPIVHFFVHEDLRPTAQQALATQGPSVVPILRQLLSETELPPTIMRHVPASLKLIPSQATVDFLFELLDHENENVRRESLRSLNILHDNFPSLEFANRNVVKKILRETKLYQQTISTLFVASQKIANPEVEKEQLEKIVSARTRLSKLLEQRLDRNLERIFRLLGLKYPTKDILVIYYGLQSNKEERRANALEFLENLLEPNLKKVIIPIVESTMLESMSARSIRQLNLKLPDEHECFRRLLASKDVRMKMAVLYLIRQMDDEKYLPLVEEATKKGRLKFREFASGILGEMKNVA